MRHSLPFSLLLIVLSAGCQTPADEPTEAKDEAFEQRMDEAWKEIRAHRKQDGSDAVADPQTAFAQEFFDYYRDHPGTPTGEKALSSAFMMWGNTGSDEAVDEAMRHVPHDAAVWSQILNGAINAYARAGRHEEIMPLIERLEAELTHPEARSAVLLRLGESASRRGEEAKAQRRLGEVVALDAKPFYVEKARGLLYEMETLGIGQPAPDFTATTIDGETIRLADLEGKVVLLDFWATTCGPCLPEIPNLKALHQRYASDLTIVGVALDSDENVLRRFLDERGMTWPQIRLADRWESELARRYNVAHIPRVYVLDRRGFIQHKDLRGEELAEAVAGVMARR